MEVKIFNFYYHTWALAKFYFFCGFRWVKVDTNDEDDGLFTKFAKSNPVVQMLMLFYWFMCACCSKSSSEAHWLASCVIVPLLKD